MRETGVVRKRLLNELAAQYMPQARTFLGILKNQMQFGGLKQLTRRFTIADGTVFIVKSIFGQDSIVIGVPTAIAPLISPLLRFGRFLCLPINQDNTFGWGEPFIDGNGVPINPPLGTPGGLFPQVIIASGYEVLRHPQYSVTYGDTPVAAGTSDWRSAQFEYTLSWNGAAGRSFGAYAGSATELWYNGFKICDAPAAPIRGAAIKRLEVGGAEYHYLFCAYGELNIAVTALTFQEAYKFVQLGSWATALTSAVTPQTMFFNSSATAAAGVQFPISAANESLVVRVSLNQLFFVTLPEAGLGSLSTLFSLATETDPAYVYTDTRMVQQQSSPTSFYHEKIVTETSGYQTIAIDYDQDEELQCRRVNATRATGDYHDVFDENVTYVYQGDYRVYYTLGATQFDILRRMAALNVVLNVNASTRASFFTDTFAMQPRDGLAETVLIRKIYYLDLRKQVVLYNEYESTDPVLSLRSSLHFPTSNELFEYYTHRTQWVYGIKLDRGALGNSVTLAAYTDSELDNYPVDEHVVGGITSGTLYELGGDTVGYGVTFTGGGPIYDGAALSVPAIPGFCFDNETCDDPQNSGTFVTTGAFFTNPYTADIVATTSGQIAWSGEALFYSIAVPEQLTKRLIHDLFSGAVLGASMYDTSGISRYVSQIGTRAPAELLSVPDPKAHFTAIGVL